MVLLLGICETGTGSKYLFEPGILILDIGGGNIITSTISCNAVKELGLEVGQDAYAVIKATSVMIGIDD